MKFIIYINSIFALTASSLIASKPPAILGQYLEADKAMRGEVVQVDIPSEFLKFRELVRRSQLANPEWFKKHIKKSSSDNPIPLYHKKLGMTKVEYDKYLALWDKRAYKRVDNGKVILRLMQDSDKSWIINISGRGMPVSLLKYVTEKDQFVSSNGVLDRIKDIKTPKESIYRDWSGHEWRYFNDGDLVKTKENIAIGRTGDGRYGLIVYSLQELSSKGSPLADDLLMIRFVPKKLNQSKKSKKSKKTKK